MKKIVLYFLFTVAAGALAWAVYLLEPESPWLPECMFHKFTRLHCPGCGGTRAVHALLHGDWDAALRNNILLLPLAGIILLIFFRPGVAANRFWVYFVLLLIGAFWIFRNIPAYPFTLLTPIPVHAVN